MDKENYRRYKIILTDNLWEALLSTSRFERESPSAIIDYWVNEFLEKRHYPMRLFQDHEMDKAVDILRSHTIRMQSDTWQNLKGLCAENSVPISSVVEFLLRRFLGFKYLGDPLVQSIDPFEKGPRYLTTGKYTFDLGEDPCVLDLQLYWRLIGIIR